MAKRVDIPTLERGNEKFGKRATGMNDADHLKRLISIYRQGLQIRQEQLARAGSTPDPSIILDIERLETTITELQQELKAVPGSDEVAPDKTWSRGYRYLKAEYSYRFSPDDIRRQEFRSKVQLEALRDGVDIIKDRYSWTGGGEQSAPVTRHHRYVVFHPSVEMNGSQYYYTHLGGEMVRGQKKEVSHYIDLFDQQRSFNSFFNRSVAIETLSLTLKVIIPEKYADTLREINFRTIDLGEDRTIALKEADYDESSGVIVWTEDDPQPGRQYAIEWDWDYQRYIKSNESPA